MSPIIRLSVAALAFGTMSLAACASPTVESVEPDVETSVEALKQGGCSMAVIHAQQDFCNDLCFSGMHSVGIQYCTVNPGGGQSAPCAGCVMNNQ